MDPTTADVCTPYPPSGPDDAPLSFSPEWLTETVLALANGIRIDGAFDRMPILADALEEAGCDDSLVLNHCRFCEHHVPDCWVLDQLYPVDELSETDTVGELPTVQVTLFQKIQRASEVTSRGAAWVMVAVVFGLPLLAAVVAVIQLFSPSFLRPKSVPSATRGWQLEVPPTFQWKEPPGTLPTGTAPASLSPSPPSPRR